MKMGKFVVVILEDIFENKWSGVPESWVTEDKKKCWWPDHDARHKAKNEIIFNGSSNGWYLRPIGDVYDTDYETFGDAYDRAFDLNRHDLEDSRYYEIETMLDDLKNNSDDSDLFDNQEKMTQALKEIKITLEALKYQVDVNKSTLRALLPIKDPKGLRKFETLFKTEGWISQALTELIVILTDNENMTESVSKILGAVFSNQFAAQCFWDGRSGIEIEYLSIIKKIYEILKNIDANYEDFEEDVTLWFQNKKKISDNTRLN